MERRRAMDEHRIGLIVDYTNLAPPLHIDPIYRNVLRSSGHRQSFQIVSYFLSVRNPLAFVLLIINSAICRSIDDYDDSTIARRDNRTTSRTIDGEEYSPGNGEQQYK